MQYFQIAFVLFVPGVAAVDVVRGAVFLHVILKALHDLRVRLPLGVSGAERDASVGRDAA